jgi:hypothetical protein
MRIVSGGQTGVDQAAWRAARASGLQTGGFMPRGFWTEQGPRPDLAEFSAIALESDRVEDRTVANVREADATLVVTTERPSPGTELTTNIAQREGKPYRVVRLDLDLPEHSAAAVVAWIAEHEITTLNVAGPRESESPGIGARADQFLRQMFILLNRSN